MDRCLTGLMDSWMTMDGWMGRWIAGLFDRWIG